MANEERLKGYLLAMSAVNQGTNNNSEFRFRKVEMIDSDLAQTLEKHFSVRDYSDYKNHEILNDFYKELNYILPQWFYYEDILNRTYDPNEAEDERVESFFSLFKDFIGEQVFTAYKVKNKGSFFIMSDYYVIQIGQDLYSLEFGTND